MTSVKSTVRPSNAAERGGSGPAFGSHLSIAGGIYKAIEAARRLSFDTVQVFVKNQRQWAAPPLNADHARTWHTLAADGDFGPTVAHATYLINLASRDDALRERSRLAFAEELRRCEALAIPYLVFHPGAAGDQPRDVAIRRVADALNRLLADFPGGKTMPTLETTAGQGSTLGRSFEELAEILERVDQPDRVAVCGDTCHVFAAGYDIRSPSEYDKMMTRAERLLGVGRIRCWHLNDSRGDCGSRLDRHEHIGRGKIGQPGFQNVLSDPRWSGIPMILETPKELDDQGRDWDSVNLELLRQIVAGTLSAGASRAKKMEKDPHARNSNRRRRRPARPDSVRARRKRPD